MSWILGKSRAGKVGDLAKVPWPLAETSSTLPPAGSKLGDKVQD